jgi:hypothetical protein
MQNAQGKGRSIKPLALQAEGFGTGWQTVQVTKERRCLGYYAVWFLQESHGVTSQKTAFFIVFAVKTSNLT